MVTFLEILNTIRAQTIAYPRCFAADGPIKGDAKDDPLTMAALAKFFSIPLVKSANPSTEISVEFKTTEFILPLVTSKPVTPAVTKILETIKKTVCVKVGRTLIDVRAKSVVGKSREVLFGEWRAVSLRANPLEPSVYFVVRVNLEIETETKESDFNL